MEREGWQVEIGHEDKEVVHAHLEVWSRENAIDLGFPRLIRGNKSRFVATGENAAGKIVRALIVYNVSPSRYISDPGYRGWIAYICQEMHGLKIRTRKFSKN